MLKNCSPLLVLLIIKTTTFTPFADTRLEIFTKCLFNCEWKSNDVITTKIRGQHAAIPLDRSFLITSITTNDKIGILAFEIYLSDNPEDYTAFKETGKVDNKNKIKLLQLVYVDLKSFTFLAKPEGFPLEQNFWAPEGIGDATSDLQIVSLNRVDSSGTACYLTYKDYLVEAPDNIIVFNLVDSTIKKSKILKSGNLGGAAGYSVTFDYKKFTQRKNKIVVELITESDCPDEKIFNVKKGKYSRIVKVLSF